MTTREKIIVGLMCVTIAYGAYELLINGSPKKKPQVPAKNSSSELQDLVTDISKQLTGKKENQGRRYLAELETGNWPKDPFIHSIDPLKKTLDQPKEEQQPTAQALDLPKLSYSGFLEVGPEKMAIINGLEYAKGEALGATEYYVRSISARHVLIGKVDGSDTIRLPLLEASD